ncbi:MAG: AAA family ATPase [Candidatus Peregrinibacteria bacterium]|nr:AAA family ATPase [Candidatus Peregrinibacteria bacterium]
MALFGNLFGKGKAEDDKAAAKKTPANKGALEKRQQAETAPLQLELKQVFTTKEALYNITKPLGVDHLNVEGRNYVIAAMNDQLCIFGMDGKCIRDLDKDDRSSGEAVVAWRAICTALGKRGLQRGESTPQFIGTDDLPFYMQEDAKQAIGTYRNTFLEQLSKDYVRHEMKKATLSVILNGKYILLWDPQERAFVAWQTELDGRPQLPRNWIRYSTATATGVPEDLTEHLRGLFASAEKYKDCKRVNDTYVAVIDNNRGIGFVRDDDRANIVYPDALPGIRENFVVDPNDDQTVFYCQHEKPTDIYELNVSGDPTKWEARLIHLPETKSYSKIEKLNIHPSGKFFDCWALQTIMVMRKDEYSGEEKRVRENHMGIVHIDRQTGAELPSPFIGVSSHRYNDGGELCGLQNGNVPVVYQTNLGTIAKEQQRQQAAKKASTIDIETLMDSDTSTKGPGKEDEPQEDTTVYNRQRAQCDEKFLGAIQQATTPEQLEQKVIGPLNRVRTGLRDRKRLSPAAVRYITETVDAALQKKNQELASATATTLIGQIRTQLGERNLPLNRLEAIQADVKAAQNLPNLPEPLSQTIGELTQLFEGRLAEAMNRDAVEIEREVRAEIDRERQRASTFHSLPQVTQWLRETIPTLQSKYVEQQGRCLPGSPVFGVYQRAQETLRELGAATRKKFEQNYDKLREQARSQLSATITSVGLNIDECFATLRLAAFPSREAAENAIDTGADYRQLEQQIQIIEEQDREEARTLRDKLHAGRARFIGEVERKLAAVTDDQGKRVYRFGSISFPIYEAATKKVGAKQTAITFIPSGGGGASPGETQGSIVVRVETGRGKKIDVIPWEQKLDAENFQTGVTTYRGVEDGKGGKDRLIAPSTMMQAEYSKIRKLYQRWQSGELKREWQSRRATLMQLYLGKPRFDARMQARGEQIEAVPGTGRELPGGKNFTASRQPRGKADKTWQGQYKKLLGEYADFCQQNAIPLLRELERIEHAPESEYANGVGFVPKWKDEWVVAPEDEEVLGEMARQFSFQLEKQCGLLDLKGPPGTGKDVYLQIFAERTKRPLFSHDCSKTDSEGELVEDIFFEAEGGATRTVFVPSKILQGIQTPGAIIYMNEFNLLPEDTQKFLNSLFDSKRSLTLKTKSGRVIKSQPDVLFTCSQNPSEGKQSHPSVLSRMVHIEVDYPPLYGKKKPGDTRSSPPFSPSEPLKIARMMRGFKDSTLEENMEKNPFVKHWDFYANGIGEDPNLPQAQQFDMQVTLCLVQLGNYLRTEFKKHTIEDDDSAVPVALPVTLREMQSCGTELGSIPVEEKTRAGADPEKLAKLLMRRYFLMHFQPKERQPIEDAVRSWSMQKRT